MLKDASVGVGRPSKLGPKQWLLCFILFMKHNITIYDAFMWNLAKSSLCNDVIFIASCINHALVDEIHWPSSFERVALGSQLRELLGCLGFINGTLVKIQEPWKDTKHWTWCNGHKKIYVMNNTMILDHHGLFIYIDSSYLGSYHDVSIFCHLAIYQEWLILHPSRWLFQVSFKGSKVLGEINVHHEKDREVRVRITTGCRPWHLSCLQQNACKV